MSGHVVPFRLRRAAPAARMVDEVTTAEVVALFGRATPEMQRACVDLLREQAGLHRDPCGAFERAEALLMLSEDAEGLANRLLDGVDQERLR